MMKRAALQQTLPLPYSPCCSRRGVEYAPCHARLTDKKRSISIVRSLLVALGLSLCAPASQAEAMTLKKAVAQTLRTNPEVLASWKHLRAKERVERQAYAAYFPTLDVSGTYGRGVDDNHGTRAIPGNATDHRLTMNKGSIDVALHQMLFDGFQTREKVKHARSATMSAGADFDNVAEGSVWNAVQAYLDNMKLQTVLELVKDNVLLHQRTLKKLQQKVQAGGGNKADVQQIMSKLALASAGHASSQVALKGAQSRFIMVVGIPPRDLIRPTPPFQQLPATLDNAIAQAIQFHPMVTAASANLSASEAEKNSVKGLFMPNIDLGLLYTNKDGEDGTPGHTQGAAARLTMQYNLSRGGADSARLQELQEQLQQKQNLLEQAQRTVREGVVTAWEGLQATRERMKQLTKYVTINRESATTTQEQFKLGKKSLMDVLGVANELFSAEVAFINEDWTSVKATYQLLFSAGRLRQTFEVDKNSEEAEPAVHTTDLGVPLDPPSSDNLDTEPQHLRADADTPPVFEPDAAPPPPAERPPTMEKTAPAQAPRTSATTSGALAVSKAPVATEDATEKMPSTTLANEPAETGTDEPPDTTATTPNPGLKTDDSQAQSDDEPPPKKNQQAIQRPAPVRSKAPGNTTLATTSNDGTVPWVHANAVARFMQSREPDKAHTAPHLILTGQYALSESSIFVFTQLVRADNNQVISSVMEEIPLTWRLQKVLALPTPTFKTLGHSAKATVGFVRPIEPEDHKPPKNLEQDEPPQATVKPDEPPAADSGKDGP